MSQIPPGGPRRTPRQVIEAALGEHLIDEDGAPLTMDLLPAATSREMAALERDLARPLPAEVRDLLSLTVGFEFAPVGTVDFTGTDMSVETFFRSVPILADGEGNFWVVDVEPESAEWGPVLYWCHDPAVLVVQAATLAGFLDNVFDLGRPGHRDVLRVVRDERSALIAERNPYLVAVEQARGSDDPVVAAFASDLDDASSVADLRLAEFGSGLAWGGRYSGLTQYDGTLLFAVRKTSLLRRLLGRT